MSSRFQSEQACIEYMAQLGGKDWRLLTTYVSWEHRKGTMSEADVPHKLKAITEQMLDPDEWRRVRMEVAKLRRAIYRQRVKGHHEAKEQRRKDYMRTYMQRYRAGKQT